MAFKLGYRPELDGLRTVAVVSVLFAHTDQIGRGADLAAEGAKLPSMLSGGLLGVDIFFVLSGFLITTILLQEWNVARAIDFKAFYIRRALRLGPAMALLLAACLVYLAFFNPSGGKFDLAAVAIAALYISNFALIFSGLRLGMLTPTWSLSVEEQFYSAWPLFFAVTLRKSRKRLLYWTIGLALLAIVLRAALYFAAWKLYSWPLFGAANHFILARADSLLFGALIAMALAWGWLESSRLSDYLKPATWAAAATLLFLLVFAEMASAFLFYAGYALSAAATAVLIVGLLLAPPAPIVAILRTKPFVWTGKISYGIYLYHLPIFALTPWDNAYLSVHPAARYLALAFALAATLGVAAASYYLVERRCLALKHRLGQPRSLQASHQKGDVRPQAS